MGKVFAGSAIVLTCLTALFFAILQGCGQIMAVDDRTCKINGRVLSCPDGSSIEILDGKDGKDGTNGTNGINGTSVTVVEFCGPAQTVYSSSFPEYGLCINNAIYGVYWDGKNSWLAEIPSGAYNSTSTSLPCTFTVTGGCTVTH